MAINVEFLFDFGSPNAYLSHLVIPRIEARTSIARSAAWYQAQGWL